ncbi:MAG TPA: hypothetical protein ENI95_01605 [Chloroflexi bacterium]|nr:hypothetical protein [Chloroflexota bacterium]
MVARDIHVYDSLDTPTLTNLLLNPAQHREIHRAALSALSRRSADQRCPRLVLILRNVISKPDRYDQEIMMAIVDILATDPDPKATIALFEVLPDMLEAGISDQEGPKPKPEFREYFYKALMTRQRESDMDVWRVMLPQLSPRTLVAMLLDPAAEPLQPLEPLSLIDRLPEPKRTRALIAAIAGVVRARRPAEIAFEAARLLKESHDRARLEEGLRLLTLQWSRYQTARMRAQADTLQTALRLIDPRPRSITERLAGKRPWAS